MASWDGLREEEKKERKNDRKEESVRGLRWLWEWVVEGLADMEVKIKIMVTCGGK